MSNPGSDELKPTQDDDDRFAPPSSAQLSSSKRVTKSHPPASPTFAAPARRTFFDPWNSSSTGHQRAENRLSGSTSWRTSRNLKLSQQYKGGLTGGRRIADTVGAGSEHFGRDGRKENGGWERGASGLRTGGQQSLTEVWHVCKTGNKPVRGKCVSQPKHTHEGTQSTPKGDRAWEPTGQLSGPTFAACRASSDKYTDCLAGQKMDTCDDILDSPSEPREKLIFQGLCFYVNGSTAPLVSDHKLKHLLSAHGARHSIALGRRTVTHVVLGTVNANGGAGGGLSATKIQKEVTRTAGKAVKYITVEWVLESIKAGRRLPESRFAPLKLAQQTQGSVFGLMNRKDATGAVHG